MYAIGSWRALRAAMSARRPARSAGAPSLRRTAHSAMVQPIACRASTATSPRASSGVNPASSRIPTARASDSCTVTGLRLVGVCFGSGFELVGIDASLGLRDELVQVALEGVLELVHLSLIHI